MAGMPVGLPLSLFDQWALAHLPCLSVALGQGARPAQDLASREGAAPQGSGGSVRRSLNSYHPPRGAYPSACRLALLYPGDLDLRYPHAPYEPLCPHRRSFWRTGLSSVRLRGMGDALRAGASDCLVGETLSRAAYTPGTVPRRSDRRRVYLALLPSYGLSDQRNQKIRPSRRPAFSTPTITGSTWQLIAFGVAQEASMSVPKIILMPILIYSDAS